MKPIPVTAAKRIAHTFGYDQVVIIARKTGDGGDHCTTYGVNDLHCAIAARIGNVLKYKVMGWPRVDAEEHDAARAALARFMEFAHALRCPGCKAQGRALDARCCRDADCDAGWYGVDAAEIKALLEAGEAVLPGTLAALEKEDAS